MDTNACNSSTSDDPLLDTIDSQTVVSSSSSPSHNSSISLSSCGSLNPTQTSTSVSNYGSQSCSVNTFSCGGKESQSAKTLPENIADTEDLSYELTENIDVKINVTNTKLNEIKPGSYKDSENVSNSNTVISIVTDSKDIPFKEPESDSSTYNKNKQIENKSNDISEKEEMSNVVNEDGNNSDKLNITGSQMKNEDLFGGCEVSCKINRIEKNQDKVCIASVSSCKMSSETSATKRIIKVEQDDNPLDYSSTGKIKLEVQNKESCALDNTPWDDNYEKSCALDYTISALNRAESVTEVSSTSSVLHINNDIKSVCSAINNISLIRSNTVQTDSPCDSSSDMSINDKTHLKDLMPSLSESVLTRPSSVVRQRVVTKPSSEDQNKSASDNSSVDQSKSVLIDTSKMLQNTDILLKDTADLLNNTSDLLNVTDSKKCMNNTNISSKESTPVNKQLASSSGVSNEVAYSSAEEYKSRHKIGSRRSSENILTYNNPVIQPYLPTSPEKSSSKTVIKRKFCVDEIAEHLAKKRAVVSLGERVKDNSYSSGSDKSSADSPIKGDKSNTILPVLGEKSNKNPLLKLDSEGNKDKVTGSLKKGNNSCSNGESDKKTQALKTKKKSLKLSKNSDVMSLPSRRIKREASLNASARVNLIYEKDTVSPRSRKHSSSSSSNSSGGKSGNKAIIKIYRSISSDSTSSKTSKPKYSRSKSVGGKIKGKRNESKSKQKIVKRPYKSISSGDSIKGKSKKTSVKDFSLKKAQLSKNEISKKQKVEIRNDRDEKAKRRKSLTEVSDASAKKIKLDTHRSARTHVTDKPKGDYTSPTGTSCVKCCQHTCPQQSRKYWNSKEDGGQTINEEEKHSDNNSSLPLDVTSPYPVQTVQLMEGSPFVVPHGHIGPCHACAAAQGGNLLSTSHSYTLSGISSLGQMMPYHQAYGGGYPVQFAPSSNTSLPHCGCPSCYAPTAGVYYPQTSTPITHQSLQHEPCMVPPHPVHIANEETEIIDVVDSEESDNRDEQSSLENLSPPIIFEKTKKKTSASLDLIKKKKKKMIIAKKNAKEKFKNTKGNKKIKKKINKDKTKSKKIIKPNVDRKPQFRKSMSKHGWEFEGHPETRKIMCHSVGSMVERSCYPCIRHVDGDVIHVRDCVLLRSGPRKSDIPYVAKVKAFWEDPISKEMMMSILWYYQPEHIEGGRKSHHLICELFASKHKDENCVACIEDKGYVLTYAEYCRFMAEQRRMETFFPPRHIVVPESLEGYPGKNKLPTTGVDPSTVYVCRQVYDFKLKRILKNPS